MADEDLNRPYIGYRSAGRRPESQQDRRASADAPLAALRGFLSGVLGAPGDIESLVRMLPGLSERTILPTSEDVERRLPLRSVSETPIGRAATSGAQLAGGFYNGPGSPLRAVAALPSAVSRAGREFLQSNVPVHVIKPKGGNWLTGSVEEAIRPLRTETAGSSRKSPEELLAEMRSIYTPETMSTMSPETTASVNRALSALEPQVSLNRWLDTKLAKYMRNEMGTPEDPIRALAEQGVLHERPAIEGPIRYAITNRESAGYPVEGMAQSELARLWENATDSAIMPRTAGQQLMAEYPHNAETMPWLEKVPPDSPVYAMSSMDPIIDNLGFRHLRDELRNALNPESGLPANLLLTPEQLGRVSTPQAVELVHKINQYRAAEKAAADAARSQNAATVLHKEYPEAGYKWVELKAPEGTSPAYLGGGKFEDPMANALQDALKYEGDIMGHCVGGYCPDVMEGKSRIFSLRSAKGEPHVTIEVAPGRSTEGTLSQSELPPDVFQDLKSRGLLDPNIRWRMNEELGRYTPEIGPFEPSIVQIKGKQNRAPKEDYLPYVQDFVRSQKWGQVGDLKNTGLLDPRQMITEEDLNTLSGMGRELPNYLTEEEYADVLKSLQNKAQGFASGGLVTYNPAEVERLTAPLRAELGLQ